MKIEPWKVSKRCRWYNFRKSIRLYHGTNDVFLPQILKRGIAVPESTEKRIKKLIRSCGVNYDKHLKERVAEEPTIDVLRRWHDKEGISLATTPYCAALYAKHNHKEGGEFNTMVKHQVGKLLRRKFPPSYPDSTPVVLEVLLPISWLSDYHLEKLKSLVDFWRQRQEESPEFDRVEYLEKSEKQEIHLCRTIPKSKIKRIMRLPPDSEFLWRGTIVS